MARIRGEWTYIGDGVHVGFDGFQLWLTTEPRDEDHPAIALEFSVMESLIKYAKRIYGPGITSV